MNNENLNQEGNSNIAKHKLCEGVVFKYSALGEPFFLRENATDCYRGISPTDWTPNELRKMADYIEANPRCKLFIDGSGS